MPRREWTEEQRREFSEKQKQRWAAKKAEREEALLNAPVAELDEEQEVMLPEQLGRDNAAAPSVDDGADLAAERRARMLRGIEPEVAATFTDADLEKIELDEKRVAQEEKRAKALEVIRKRERMNQRTQNDLIPPDVLRSQKEQEFLNEPVTFRVVLPDSGAGRRDQAGFRVDGFLYEMNQVYTRPRHIFLSLQANHYGAWLAETTFRTLDQHKPGQAARFILANQIPPFEVRA